MYAYVMGGLAVAKNVEANVATYFSRGSNLNYFNRRNFRERNFREFAFFLPFSRKFDSRKPSKMKIRENLSREIFLFL